MSATLTWLKDLRSPLHTSGRTHLWARVTQDDESAVGEEWSIPGLPVFCALVGFQTRFTAAGTSLLLRPQIGAATGFSFGAATGTGIARYRRQVEVVRATAGVSMILPEGTLYGVSGLSRNLAPTESLVTDLIFADVAENAQRGAEVNGDWEIGQPSTVSIAVGSAITLQPTFANATPLAAVPCDGAHEIELWLDFTEAGGSTDPSDVRVQWQHRRSASTGWAPVLWEDIANAVLAAGVATIPTGAYEVQDTLGNITPSTYPYTRHYVLPARNWSGDVRAIVYNSGATADGASVAATMIIRGA